ncbi:hypothetical protein BgiMline_027520 [Biomphalaria glabrata]
MCIPRQRVHEPCTLQDRVFKPHVHRKTAFSCTMCTLRQRVHDSFALQDNMFMDKVHSKYKQMAVILCVSQTSPIIYTEMGEGTSRSKGVLDEERLLQNAECRLRDACNYLRYAQPKGLSICESDVFMCIVRESHLFLWCMTTSWRHSSMV